MRVCLPARLPPSPICSPDSASTPSKSPHVDQTGLTSGPEDPAPKCRQTAPCPHDPRTLPWSPVMGQPPTLEGPPPIHPHNRGNECMIVKTLVTFPPCPDPLSRQPLPVPSGAGAPGPLARHTCSVISCLASPSESGPLLKWVRTHTPSAGTTCPHCSAPGSETQDQRGPAPSPGLHSQGLRSLSADRMSLTSTN